MKVIVCEKMPLTYMEESNSSTLQQSYVQKYEGLNVREHIYKLSQQDGLKLWDVWDEECDYAECNPSWRNMLLIRATAREKKQTIMETAPTPK